MEINTNQSMYGYIRDCNADPKQIKAIYFGKKFSFEKIFAAADSVATYLYNHGVKKGDSVVLCLPNIPQAIIALYAINKIGAIANVVHPKIGTKALQKIIHETGTNWVFLYSKVVLIHGRELRKDGVNVVNCRISEYLTGYRKMVLGPGELLASKNATVDFHSMLVKAEDIDIKISGKDTAIYLHSSGTTGESKTVMLSSYALNELSHSANVGCDQLKVPWDCESIMMLPLFHGFGLGICLHFVMSRGKIILQPSFDAKSTVQIMQKNQVSFLCCVPTMLKRICKQKGFEGEHLKYLKAIFVGGDKLDDRLRSDVEEQLSRNESTGLIYEGFGLSEAASLTHLNLHHRNDGTVGEPMCNVKAKIMGENGECAPGEEGELYVASTSLMNGYLNYETKFVVDEEGVTWFPTGDYGYIDATGYLYYRGRLKRLIKIGGVNIFPQEVETVACLMKEIDNACAVRTVVEGKPCLKLLVKLHEGVRMNPLLKIKIKEFIKDNIIAYAVPKEIEAVSEIKLNSMGKCDYRAYEDALKQ